MFAEIIIIVINIKCAFRENRDLAPGTLLSTTKGVFAIDANDSHRESVHNLLNRHLARYSYLKDTIVSGY